jgi:hypothetical protein
MVSSTSCGWGRSRRADGAMVIVLDAGIKENETSPKTRLSVCLSVFQARDFRLSVAVSPETHTKPKMHRL